MKIIQVWEYFERILYLTQIDTKYQLFYKSTGKAGHNSKGEVFPILLLKEQNKEVSPDGFGLWNTPGWLPKLYVYDEKFIEYKYKIKEEFPDVMHKYLDFLKIQEVNNTILTNNPKAVNDFCRNYIKTKDDYIDWYKMEKENE